MASIKDIANKLNLSISTVSYALRDSDKISDKTKQDVQRVAKELNYVPSTVARIMQGQQSNIIGVFIRDFGGYFFGDVLLGIRSELDLHGYEMVVSSSVSSFRLLSHEFFEGSIILGDSFSESEAKDFIATGKKVVLLDRSIKAKNVSCVLIDNEQGVQIALQKLMDAQHHKNYILSGPENNYDARTRLQAIKKIIGNDEKFKIIPGDFSKSSGEEFAEDYKIESQNCGVLCLNDEMAMGIYSKIKDYKKIGKAISIIGFDDIEIAKYLNPPLSSIGFDRTEWGKESAREILRLIENKVSSNKKIKVTLNEGKSIYE